ncbi:chorismate mutase [Litchfieldia salsa]|uniref:chorismate mutase n=1 Tax=Litchfieldia salsa TaxID=930152 RepID=A0A1H0WFP4_9BACI|nr:chorismate mutase [Litchfieldia salsa]SDP89305.1 chorismate mutase [Litchfieldia salsa]
MIRGVRGATTVAENNDVEIIKATDELVKEMISKNHIAATDVAQVLISVTNDLDAVFPAAALRKIEGWSFVPVMCMQEIPVPNSLRKCIRVMMTVNTSIPQENINHIYLGNAVSLRPDLKAE